MSPPPPPIPIPGVTMEILPIRAENGAEIMRDYYVLDLSKFTAATMLGNDDKRWNDSAMHGESLHAPLHRVPIGNLVRWLKDEKQHYWRDNAKARENSKWGDTRRMAAELYKSIIDEPLNNHAIDAVDDANGWILTHMPPDHPWGPGAPVTIYLDATLPGLKNFGNWYGQRLEAAADSQVSAQCAGLRKTLGAAIDKLEDAFDERDRARQVMMPYMQKLQGGLTIIDMCLDFIKSPAERKKMWKTWKYAHLDYVVPMPDAGWISRAKTLRSEWSRDLIGGCASVMDSKHSAGEIDKAANAVVDALRDPGAPYLTLLDRWEHLSGGAQDEVNNTVRNAIRLALQSPSARERLLRGELGALAKAVAVLEDPVGPSDGKSQSKTLRDAVENFDPKAVFGSTQDTPLGKMIADKYVGALGIAAHNGIVCEILGIATPFIVADIKRRQGFTTPASYNAVAWLWCSVVGTTKFSKEVQKDFWGIFGPMFDFDGSKTKFSDYTRKFELFDYKKGTLNAAYAKSATVMKTVGVLMRVMIIHYATHEWHKAPGSLEKRLEYFQSVAEFVKSAFEVAPTEYASDKLLKMVKDHSGVEKLEVNLGTAVGIIADGLSFAVSVEKYYRAETLGKSKKTQREAGYNVFFDGLSFALSVFTAITGAEVILLGFAIYVAKNLITDPDSWVPSVPGSGVAKKPGPHVFLEKLLQDMLDDEKFLKEMKTLEEHGSKGLVKLLEYIYDRVETPPRDDTALLWDIGGTAESNLTYGARSFVRAHWLLPKDTTNAIVRPCQHG